MPGQSRNRVLAWGHRPDFLIRWQQVCFGDAALSSVSLILPVEKSWASCEMPMCVHLTNNINYILDNGSLFPLAAYKAQSQNWPFSAWQSTGFPNLATGIHSLSRFLCLLFLHFDLMAYILQDCAHLCKPHLVPPDTMCTNTRLLTQTFLS